MKTWEQAIRDGIVSGGIAAPVSTAVLAARGQYENGSALGPVNAVSHWIWGDEAARHDGASARYSLPGYMIHHSASTIWAILYEKWFGEYADNQEIGKALSGGLAVSTLACFVDYKMTPHRLQPGYEMRLSKRSLLFVYAAFGLGMALRGLASGTKLRLG
jgi:hypothetical protein